MVGLDANIVGTVGDLAISSDGKVAIQVNKKNPAQSSGKTDEDEGADLFLNSDEVLAIGDVVLLRHSSSLAGKQTSVPASDKSFVTPSAPIIAPTGYNGPSSTPPPFPTVPASTASISTGNENRGRICSRCNYVNGPSSRFCIKCGTALI